MNIKEIAHKGQKFINEDLWKTDTADLSSFMRNVFNVLRILVRAAKGYIEGKVVLRASALTYYTILSIVPCFAIAFAIAKGFGLETMLMDYIRDSMSGAPDTATYFIEFIDNALAHTQSGIIAGIGVVLLLYSVFSLISNIEEAFNSQWCVKKSRTITRKMTDYLCIILLTPILLILSSSATVFMRSFFHDYLSGTFTPLQTFLLDITPYVLMTITFTLVFVVIPNTRVRFVPAIIAGLITAVAFELMQWVYITFQIGVNKAGAIYGSFAFLPLFLSWLQIVWTLVLAGCKICFSIQTAHSSGMDSEVETTSIAHEEKIALVVMLKICRQFTTAFPKSSGNEILKDLHIPYPVFFNVMSKLKETGLVVELTTENDEEHTYVPGMSVQNITPNLICQRLRTLGKEHDFDLKSSEELVLIEKTLGEIHDMGQKECGNSPLIQI